MVWQAVDQLEPAIEATKRLLLPFELRRWLVLGIVVFFVSGSTGSGSSTSFNAGEITLPAEPVVDLPDQLWEFPWAMPADELGSTMAAPVGPRTWMFVLALVVLFLLVGLVFAYVAAVFEFVFVELARSREVRIRGYFGAHLRTGLSLFLFRLAVGVAIIAGTVGLLLLVFLTGGLFLIVLLVGFPVFVLLGVGIWVIFRFTVDFVVPVMIAEHVGLLRGWSLFASEMHREWQQYTVYAVVRAILGFMAGLVLAIGYAAIAVFLAIPFLLLGLPGFFLLVSVLGLEVAGIVWAVGLGGLFVLLVVVVGTISLQVPVQTYLRYYSLFVLGATSSNFELLGDLRADLAVGD